MAKNKKMPFGKIQISDLTWVLFPTPIHQQPTNATTLPIYLLPNPTLTLTLWPSAT